jgi:hypothetical protein
MRDFLGEFRWEGNGIIGRWVRQPTVPCPQDRFMFQVFGRLDRKAEIARKKRQENAGK